jgi:xanthine/uracil permease
MTSSSTLAAASEKLTKTRVFDVGINEPLPAGQFLLLGLQNVFGMTGMFVFPGLLGRSFNLGPEQVAYLYGMTFATCGLITILQSVWLLRLPIVQGPYAGSFAALLAVGHLQSGGLGAAYGSFFVASLIWCVLTVPVRGFSFIGLFARFLRAPIISGMIVMLVIMQISNVALPNWIGAPGTPGFPLLNLLAGAVAVAALVVVSLWADDLAARCDFVRAGGRNGVLCGGASDLVCSGGQGSVARDPAVVSFRIWRKCGVGDRVFDGADSAGNGLDGHVSNGGGLG